MKIDDPKTSPEISALISCMRNFFTDEPVQIANNLDWDKLFECACKHKVMLLVYHVLRKNNWENSELEKWSLACKEKQNRNIFIIVKFLNLLDNCKKNGIEVIGFKGPALANMLYGNLVIRGYCDVDILVAKEDLLKLEKIFVEENLQPYEQLDFNQCCKLLSKYRAILWRNKSLSVDVHCQLHSKYFGIHINTLPWRDNLQTVFVDKQTLAAEVYLLYLCTHAMKHKWQYLIAICDIAQLIRTFPGLDWQKVLAYARKAQSTKMLYIGLILCEKIVSVPVPDYVKQEFSRNKKLYKIADDFILNIHLLVYKRNWILSFSVHDRILTNLCSIFYFITTPVSATMKIVKLPDKLFWMYSVINIFYFLYRGIVYYPFVYIFGKLFNRKAIV